MAACLAAILLITYIPEHLFWFENAWHSRFYYISNATQVTRNPAIAQY
jgi:hypothetical protein